MKAGLSVLLVFGVLAVGGCASAERPITWVRADGRPADEPAVRLAHAQCRAEALAAGARYGQARVLEAYAQVPQIDFSPLGRLGDDYARGRQMGLQDEMIRAAMVAGMARSGYLQQS